MSKHGGNIDFISKKYNKNKYDIIDFSSNINPLGFPSKIKNIIIDNINNIKIYPDSEYKNLRNSISNYVKIETQNIVVGNGTTELIALFIKTINPKKAVLIAPVYSEYSNELNKINCEIELFQIYEEDNFNINIERLLSVLVEPVELIILCNPNNPTGTLVSYHNMEVILEVCHKKNIKVMVDETYMEFCFDYSYENKPNLTLKYSNLFIIRGTSKFFCIPGLRLGYGMCSNTQTIQDINKNKIPWSVNVLAENVGNYIFTDTEFTNKTKEFMIKEKKRVFSIINKFEKLKAYETHSNFILVKILDKTIKSEFILEELLKYNILIRDAREFDFLDNSFIRFCILNKESNNLLLEKLQQLI